MNILILGVTGMLGNAVMSLLSTHSDLKVYGTARSSKLCDNFTGNVQANIIAGVDVENFDTLVKVFGQVRPDVVVNCIGLVKQLAEVNDPLRVVPINTLLPHRVASLCEAVGARFVHVSTDCVFSGRKGNYTETDFPDAHDLYGRTKLLGEVDYPHAVTLRTSIIGRELSGNRSLIGWFLAQQGSVKGFRKAIFSGLPTDELARVIRDYVLPNPELHGLYHVASQPINKYKLLRLVATTYGKDIEIIPSDDLVIDRSLIADRFRKVTGYVAPEWPILVENMFTFNNSQGLQ